VVKIEKVFPPTFTQSCFLDINCFSESMRLHELQLFLQYKFFLTVSRTRFSQSFLVVDVDILGHFLVQTGGCVRLLVNDIAPISFCRFNGLRQNTE